jgi:arylamine N-acetyltransferase
VRGSLEAARKDVDATRAACDRAIELAGAAPGTDDALSMQLDRAVHLVDAGAGEAALLPLLALLPRVEEATPSPTTARIFRELAERSWQFADRRARARAWMERAHEQFVQLELLPSASGTKAWLDGHAL